MRVHEALLELITIRALQPVRHPVENALAGPLGVSRQPVREALPRLNAEGRGDPRPAPSAFVHEPAEQEADRLLSVCVLLKAEAARLAADDVDRDASPASTPRSSGRPATRCWPSRRPGSTGGCAGTALPHPRWPGSAAAGPGSSTVALVEAMADRDEWRATRRMREHTEPDSHEDPARGPRSAFPTLSCRWEKLVAIHAQLLPSSGSRCYVPLSSRRPGGRNYPVRRPN